MALMALSTLKIFVTVKYFSAEYSVVFYQTVMDVPVYDRAI